MSLQSVKRSENKPENENKFYNRLASYLMNEYAEKAFKVFLNVYLLIPENYLDL